MPTPFFNPAWPLHRHARDERELVEDVQIQQEAAALTTPAPEADDPKGAEAWFDEDTNLFDIG